MVESGLRFAFAFLPAGVAVVVGLVLAVQRRKVQPDVATPAFWGLALQLVAIIAGALINVIPSSIVQGGGDPQTAITVATVISLVVAALTVVSWVLILTALFRRLPAAVAGADAPTTAVPTPPPGNAFEPFADDAPTGRHALLDEHGQQVVAQAGVRLSPQTAGLAAGAAGVAGVGAAAAAPGSGPFAAAPVPAHTADLPTEAVPVVREAGPSAAGDAAAEQPDPGPAGVDESAVGGTPTGADPDGAGAPASPAEVAPPVVSGESTQPDPGPAGVDEAAVGGTPTGPDASDDASEAATDLTPTPDAARAADGVAAAAAVDVDEAAVGGTPTTADADPGTPSTADGAAPTGPASAPQPAVRPSPGPQPSLSGPASAQQPAVRPSPRPTPSPESSADAPAADEDQASDSSSGAPASHPGLAGTMRPPRPTPTPAGGSDLFSPSAPIPQVADEAVGGTPVEPQESRAARTRSSSAPVAGWFEPVTDGSADGFGTENRDN